MMLSAITKYMPRWLMAIIATALVLAAVVGSSQDAAQAIDPADTDTVYIADGTNFADALMGATIASLNTSPMLGVAGTNSGDTIPGDTVAELDRLTNNKADLLDTIFVFGGTSAVSSSVFEQLGQWANDVQRIQGDSRWGTYQAISQLLPSAIDEAVHAQEADHATEADNADTLDGMDSSEFLGATEQAADADTVDGIDSPQLQLPGVLPSGRTLRGVYVNNDQSDGSGQRFQAGVSFPLPLPADLDDPQVHFIADGDTPPLECPGTVDDPHANPGHLCVYESFGLGYSDVSICNLVNQSCDAADRFGFLVLVDDDSTAGTLTSRGNWAVTAP